MYTEENIKELIYNGKLTIVDDNLLISIRDAYFKWKELNMILASYGGRRVNFSNDISEPVICKALGLLWSNKNVPGDAYTIRGEMVEIKASSHFNRDTTSFSPRHGFDILIFGRLDYDRDLLYIYDLNMNSNQLKDFKANETESFGEQQNSKRRPRTGIIKNIIEAQGLKPICIFNYNDLSIQYIDYYNY